MEYKKLKELWTEVAQHLTGKPVIVRRRDPVVDLAVGGAYRFNNQAVIDIGYDNFDEEAAYQTLLHEIGHIASQFDQMGGNPNLPPKSVKFTKLHLKIRDESHMEDEPNRLAAEWDAWATKNRYDYAYDGESATICKLRALAHYPVDPAVETWKKRQLAIRDRFVVDHKREYPNLKKKKFVKKWDRYP